MNEISPTRMNLLTRRGQLGLAVRGKDLLEKKRDALVQEFFANVHEALEARRQLYQAAQESHRALMLAKSFDGPQAVETLSLGMPVRFEAQDPPAQHGLPHTIPSLNGGPPTAAACYASLLTPCGYGASRKSCPTHRLTHRGSCPFWARRAASS